MIAIKKARKLIKANPTGTDAQIISSLVLSLQSEGSISVSELYQLEHANFLLALEILAEWRLDRYYASKQRLLDVSDQAAALTAQGLDATPPDPGQTAA